MASWAEVEREAPELVARARGFFDSHVHKTLATTRRDGSPRISGTELTFADGELWVGSMPGAVKALDLRRDPRFALHSGSDDPPGWGGDAKIAGRAEEVDDNARKASMRADGESPGDFHLFRLDVSELVVVGLNEERNPRGLRPPTAGLCPAHPPSTESWHEGRGVQRRERA